jgi:3-oxoacyl-[acyl-carrier-protein] synthase II
MGRGAWMYAVLVGYGMSADALHIPGPSLAGDGEYRVMRAAIEDAGVRVEDVSYINAHGTSTPQGDSLETLAIKRAFGDHARKLAVSSTKSMTGHLLGAAGGLEAGITALAVHHQVVPPTINLDSPDPECDLDYVPMHCRPLKMTYALSNSFGFGGTNAALLFKRLDA